MKNCRNFLVVKIGLNILLCVKDLTFRNSDPLLNVEIIMKAQVARSDIRAGASYSEMW